MDLIFFLCVFAVSPAFGENQFFQNPNPVELDRARSAWNFGGQHVKRGHNWMSRAHHVPGTVIADRRLGAPPVPANAKPTVTPVLPQKQKPKHLSKKAKKSPVKHPRMVTPKLPKAPLRRNMPPQPVNKKRSLNPSPSNYKYRAPREISSRSDTPVNFMNKDDFWHLDKGEAYSLKNEDIEFDNHLREHHLHDHESDEDNEIHDEQEDARHKLEAEAEKMVNNHEDEEHEHIPHHIHHHHHYDQKNATQEIKKPEKKPDAKKLTPLPLPRIHNPIPLGCLLAVPSFHPIRPRHHLTCLLSIPGTPNLMKKRRKRSTDSQQQQQQQPGSPAIHPQGQFIQMSPNQRYGTQQFSTRKYYSNPMGGGKNPHSSQPTIGNLKVPATIIPPPQFDQSDIMSMLLGSQVVDPNEVGKILLTNNRYVRIGRGLPNSSPRKGRNLWGPSPVRDHLRYNTPAAISTDKQQQAANTNTQLLVSDPAKAMASMKTPITKPSKPLVFLTPHDHQHNSATANLPVPSATPQARTPSAPMTSSSQLPSNYFQSYQSNPTNSGLSKTQPKQIRRFPTSNPKNGIGIAGLKTGNMQNVAYTQWKPMLPDGTPVRTTGIEFLQKLLESESQTDERKVKPVDGNEETTKGPQYEDPTYNLDAAGSFGYDYIEDASPDLDLENDVRLELDANNDAENFLHTDSKPISFSYAIKNENSNSFSDEKNTLRFNLPFDYYDELDTHSFKKTKKSKLKFPKLIEKLDPIFIKVPKQN